MKDLRLLAWLTQLGLSVVAPLVGFPLLALFLRDEFGWGDWVIWVAIGLGIISAIEGFRSSLRAMKQMSKPKKETPPPSFNDHE